jgi:hypothetical protein
MRRMYDLGSFAVLGIAPLLARVLKSDEESLQHSLVDVRTYGVHRPEVADDVPTSNLYRMMAWLFLMLGALAFFVVTSLARSGPSSATTSFLEWGMRIAAVLGITFIGMMFMSLIRFGLASLLSGELRSRMGDGAQAKLGVVGWLTLPNSADLLPALFFAACLAPEVFP